MKVTLQVNRAQTTQTPSTIAVTKEIIRTQVSWEIFAIFPKISLRTLFRCYDVLQGLGLRGLNKGLTATIARNGVFNMVYFGFYHSVKGLIPQVKVCCTISLHPNYMKPKFQFLYCVSCFSSLGLLAGIFQELWYWLCVWHISIMCKYTI